MPIYEYLCHACAARFEKYVQAFGQAVECPECHGAELEKLLSTFAMAGGGPGPRGDAAPGGGGGCCGGGCGCAH